MSKRKLLIITRYPEAGLSKTRLIPALGENGAAELQRRMTEQILNTCKHAAKQNNAELEIHYAGGNADIMSNWLGNDLTYIVQADGDLGKRIASAIDNSKAEHTVVIGADCPDITEAIISEAFSLLTHKDLVIGPATDGGYYLIGLQDSKPELFQNIDWGTGKVLEQTLNAAIRMNLNIIQLQELTDIDRPEDLQSLTIMDIDEILETARISVVIPALNEEDNICSTISKAKKGKNVEIIVVDGGSIDSTISKAEELGATVITSEPGRAKQMNLGAANANGEILLFLHADTHLPENYSQHIRRALNIEQATAGAFQIEIDNPRHIFRIAESIINFRSSVFQLPYGDQAIFLKKATFIETGKFQDIEVMEDYDFIKRIRKHGRITIVPRKVTTDGRRWTKLGFWKTTYINQLMVAGFRLGISPNKLSEFYRRRLKKQR